jgi:hypothetical protein
MSTSTQPSPPVPVESLRLLVDVNGSYFKLATLTWTSNDASVYILPYVPESGVAYAGTMMIPGPGGTNKMNFTRQLRGTNPKMSLHESGRCNVVIQADGAIPISLFGRPLIGSGDGHVASICSFDVTRQPTVEALRSIPKPDGILGQLRVALSIAPVAPPSRLTLSSDPWGPYAQSGHRAEVRVAG